MIDNKGHARAILMDLSKAFEDHVLLVAKLNVCEFSKKQLNT